MRRAPARRARRWRPRRPRRARPGPRAIRCSPPRSPRASSRTRNYGLDDPSPGTSYYADTRLLLGLLNETPTQTFALGLDTGLRALWEAEEDFDFTFASPSTATLDYGNEWASGALGRRS